MPRTPSWRGLAVLVVVLAATLIAATGAVGAVDLSAKERSLARQIDVGEAQWADLQLRIDRSRGRSLKNTSLVVFAVAAQKQRAFLALASDTSLRAPFRKAARKMAFAWGERRGLAKAARARAKAQTAARLAVDKQDRQRHLERENRLATVMGVAAKRAEIQGWKKASDSLGGFAASTLGLTVVPPRPAQGFGLSATSTFTDKNGVEHSVNRLADNALRTSWFSTGGRSEVDIRMPQAGPVAEVAIFDNSQNRNKDFREGLGFRGVEVTLRDDAGSVINRVRVAPPSSRFSNTITAHPMVTSANVRTITLRLSGPQNPGCGGISEVILLTRQV